MELSLLMHRLEAENAALNSTFTDFLVLCPRNDEIVPAKKKPNQQKGYAPIGPL